MHVCLYCLIDINISASEPFAVNRTSLNNAVNQEASNILNRNNNSSSEKENHEEPPSKMSKLLISSPIHFYTMNT